jgi:signal peptidase
MTTIAAGQPAAVPAPTIAGRHRPTEAGRRGVAPLSIVRTALRWVINVLLIVLMVGSVALAVFIGVERVGFSPVLSPSMAPTFAPGDLILTKPEAATDVRVGQVVVLPVPGEPGQRYVHRIIKVEYEKGLPVVRTKGDANSAAEDYRLRITSDTVPLVVHTVPHLGRLAVLLRGGIWRLIAICVIGGLLLLSVKRALLDR